jgi:hypothetical protein
VLAKGTACRRTHEKDFSHKPVVVVVVVTSVVDAVVGVVGAVVAR